MVFTKTSSGITWSVVIFETTNSWDKHLTQEELKAFLAIIDGDSGLQAKLLAVRSSDDILSMIKEYGWPSIADQNSFLSDAEIESVAGGLAVMSLGGWFTCD